MLEPRSYDMFVYHGSFVGGVFERIGALGGIPKTLDAWHHWLTDPSCNNGYSTDEPALILRCDDAPHKYLYLHGEHMRLPVKKDRGRGLFTTHIFPEAQWVDEDQLDTFIAKVTLTGVPK